MLNSAAMFQYPEFDPIAFQIGPLAVRWYGLMYLVGFVLAWWLFRVRARKPDAPITVPQAEDLIFYGALGVILGGRIGYVLFYGLGDWAEDPLFPLKIWKGGMSFHGGLLGVMAASWLYARKVARKAWEIIDFAAPAVPLGLGLGRIGNFINGELWGKPTEVPWAVVYRGEALHPSQLYEALLEGLVLFIVLWIYSSKPRPTMAVSGMFAILYGVFRFAIEFVRVPDQHIGTDGFIAFGWLTMGQLLSIPLIFVGIALMWLAYRGAGAPQTQAGT